LSEQTAAPGQQARHAIASPAGLESVRRSG
jgi:hypothetical protein